MSSPLPLHLNEAQRAFVEGAESVGAAAPSAARGLAELPHISSRELQELLELGLVREAADWRFYVYRSRRTEPALAAPRAAAPSPWPPPPPPRGVGVGRYARTLIFWILVLLIPILFLQLRVGR